MKTSIAIGAATLGFFFGVLIQRGADHDIVAHAAEQRLGTMYQTPRGDNWALAHIYMPACNGKRVVDAPERDERDALTVYCYDGEQSTKDELADMAGNQ